MIERSSFLSLSERLQKYDTFQLGTVAQVFRQVSQVDTNRSPRNYSHLIALYLIVSEIK